MDTQLNSVEQEHIPLKALTRAEIKREMKRRRGYTMASYSRLVKRSPGAITRLADGQIGGDLRERFLKFFNFTEEEVPYRGWRAGYRGWRPSIGHKPQSKLNAL